MSHTENDNANPNSCHAMVYGKTARTREKPEQRETGWMRRVGLAAGPEAGPAARRRGCLTFWICTASSLVGARIRAWVSRT